MASPAASLTACSSSSAASSPVTIGPDSLPTGIEIVFWEEERVNVLQLTVGTETIARRIDNSYVNGTKMMNLCGLTRGRRDSALKNIREREVVLKGPRNLKGVWIPLDKACSLADRFNLTQVAPLLERDLVHHPALDDPLTLRQSRPTRPSTNPHQTPVSHSLSTKRRAAQHLQLHPNSHSHHSTFAHHYQHHRPTPLHLQHQSPLALGVGLRSQPPSTSGVATAPTPSAYAATPALSTASPGSTACTSPNLDGGFSGPLPTPQASSWAPFPNMSDASEAEASWANPPQGYFAIPTAPAMSTMSTPTHQAAWASSWPYPGPAVTAWPSSYVPPGPAPSMTSASFPGFQPPYFAGFTQPVAADAWGASGAWMQQGYWAQKPMQQAQQHGQGDLNGDGLGSLGLLLDA